MWLVASGALRHIIGNHGNITNIMERRLSQRVEVGDNHNYAFKGVGKASIELESGNNVHRNNVLYVLGLKNNLVYISCLEDKGDRVAFADGKVLEWSKVSSIDDARVIGIREGRLYRLVGQPTQALVHGEINPSELWHKRYGHLHYRALPKLNKIFSGVLELHIDHKIVCKGCALDNNIKKPFPSSDNRSKEALDLIQFDVCGPMPMISLGGSLYYVTFFYEFSHKMWIYLRKINDEVFTKFQEFKAEVENLARKKINILRFDNGGEYTLKKLVAFCEKVGIKRELIIPYNSQQNGVVERKNRFIK